jgi:hypothetical protein
MLPIEPSEAQLDHYYIHEPCLNDSPSSYPAKRVHSPQPTTEIHPEVAQYLDCWNFIIYEVADSQHQHVGTLDSIEDSGASLVNDVDYKISRGGI